MQGTIVNRRLCQVIIGFILLAPSLAALPAAPQSPVSDTVSTAPADITPMAIPVDGTTLRVLLGRTLLLRSADPLKRVSVTNPDIATAVTVSPNEIIIHGLSLGGVSLILWDDQQRSRSFELYVELEIEALRQTIQRLF